MQKQVLDMWVVNDTLFLKTEDGVHELKNPYVSDIKFGDLDSKSNEVVTMVGNNKFWTNAELSVCSGVIL